ncbi:MAG: DCC1-like thiol-disulfide oxidoreductase family protein [Bacteroidota bacterium]
MILNKKLNTLFLTKISSKTLAVFRIAFFSVLLFEVIRIYRFRNLIYDKIPYFEPAEITYDSILIIWGIVVTFLIIGFKNKTFSIINFVISLFLIGTLRSYEYHMFYAYMGVNFMSIFIPISKSYSIDNLIEKLNHSTLKKEHKPNELVPEFYYYIIIFMGIGVVYFDSIFFKLISPLWLAGLGTWYPASMPFAVNIDSSIILNNEFLIKYFGYLTIVFEIVFIFLFWNKKFKLPFFIIGLGLHIGIYILFPIPLFALGVIAIYLLLLPPNFIEKIKFHFIKKQLIFFYDNECPLCLRTKIVIEHFDLFKAVKFVSIQENYNQYPELEKIGYANALDNIYSISNKKVYEGVDTYIAVLFKMIYTAPFALLLKIPGIYHIAKKVYSIVAKNRNTERCTEDSCEIGFNPTPNFSNEKNVKVFINLTIEDLKKLGFKALFFTLISFQILVSLKSPLISRFLNNEEASNSGLQTLRDFSKSAFGITNHEVFMDYHFNYYNHIIKIEYVTSKNTKILLPIIDNNGMPAEYLKGFNWVKWTFRVMGSKVYGHRLNEGIRDFTAYWLHNNLISGDPTKNHTFIISVKKIDSPKGWQKDFLKHQLNKPWIEAGTATWDKKKFTLNLLNIESI